MAHGNHHNLAVLGMYESQNDTRLDSTDYVCCGHCWADDKRRETVDGERSRSYGRHPRRDCEWDYVQPEIRVIKQGVVKRRGGQ